MRLYAAASVLFFSACLSAAAKNVQGNIIDPSGAPVADAQVSVVTSLGVERSFVSTNGAFACSLPDGARLVIAARSAEGLEEVRKSCPNEVATVAIDLRDDWPTALRAARFDAGQPTGDMFWMYPMVTAMEAGQDAMVERNHRRIGLGICLVAIAFMLVGLWLYIKKLES